MLNIKIDHRQIIPVRLIPFVTGRRFSPDVIASILADDNDIHRVFIASFHLDADGNYQPMLPKEWDTVCSDLDALNESLDATEITHNQNYPIWRRESIDILLPATFVWLDELKDAWNKAYSENQMHIIDERPGDRVLNLSPYIPFEMTDRVYQGFEFQLGRPPVSNTQSHAPTISFSELHHTMTLDPFYEVESVATESVINSIYHENSGNPYFEQFKHRFSLLPCKADKQRHLIYLWCGLMGLPGYTENQVLDWQREEFLDHWTEGFDLRLNEIKEFLRKHRWPLPSRLFPNEVDNSERKLALDEAMYEAAFHDFTVVLPQLKKDLAELLAIQPESMDARQRKKDEIEQIKRRIEVIMTGSPGETSQSSTSTRNTKLQIAANELAEQMKKENHKNITKRVIANKLATRDKWAHMTESRIERLISKKW